MKQIVVLGGGISGYGSAILAKKKGFGVFLSDAGRIADRYKAKLDEWEVPYEEGGHTEERILAATEVVKSPGIPDTAGPEQNAGSKYSVPEQTNRRRRQPQARFRYADHTRGTRM